MYMSMFEDVWHKFFHRATAHEPLPEGVSYALLERAHQRHDLDSLYNIAKAALMERDRLRQLSS